MINSASTQARQPYMKILTDDQIFETAYHASTCAVTMNRMERYEDAERHFLRAVELNPNNANYHFNLATAQRFLGRA